jgi:hypothetical protein
MDRMDREERLAAGPRASGRAARPRAITMRLTFGTALPALAVLVILLTLFTPTPHLAHGIRPTFVFTLFSALVLSVAAFIAALVLSGSDLSVRLSFVWLPAALILAIGVAAELAFVPREIWIGRMAGAHPFECFASIFLLSLPILAGALWALRSGTPAHAHAAGACAGLLAGAVSAALFLVHCPENSLLYTLAWHVPAITLTAAIGAIAGGRLLRG